MKINLNRQDSQKLENLINQKYLNLSAVEFYDNYLKDGYLSIQKESIQELMKKGGLKETDAFYMALLLSEDISPESEDVKALERTNKLNEVTRLNPDTYLHHDFTDLPVEEKKVGNWELKYNYFDCYEGFLYDDSYADNNSYFAERNYLGFFTKKVPYLTVLENNVVWMSITPYEINTMKKSINNAHGNVIAYGLGLGYFALSALKNPNVNHVTVIEKDRKAIKLFEEEIKPKARFANNIEIINSDAYAFNKKNLKNGNYDFAFFDIYHDATDGLIPYIKMKKQEVLSPDTQYEYWIENSILILLRRYIITLFEEYLNGYTENDYLINETEEDRIINSIYKAMKAMEFVSYDEIHEFLKDDNLKKFAKSIEL